MTATQREYATALFRLAEETGETDAVARALHDWRDAVREEPAYLQLLSTPSLPLREREEAIGAAFGPEAPKNAVSFVKLLCRRGHIRDIGDCIDAYDALLLESRRVSVAQVTSAVPLTEEQKAALQKKLEQASGRHIELECTQDPALLGGITVRMDGQILDGSLRRRLRDWKEAMDHEPTDR